MHLKNITVLGFKSFADKTAINFEPGVTAIVGPNGCGKSNVSDAIRWVLGEQSAKALRGGEMADVIFNGTDNRKPNGMAEVSLTVGGVGPDHLSAGGVELAYDEVTLTRRVFRDGGSEYFINKVPCRLRDIQQLFMGTGVGRTSYSIMAQGNITQILSSKAEDRRLVFEEAAGITKFKAHKREALRKLEQTEQNLLRVSDLIRELKRQIGSLQRQAGKARRHRQLSTQLQHLDTQLARHQFDVIQNEISGRRAIAENLRLDAETCSESLLQSEDELLQLRGRLSEIDASISELKHGSLELKGQSERHESRIHFNEQRLAELAHQHGQALDEIAQAQERSRTATEEQHSLAERITGARTAVDQHRNTLAERLQILSQFEAALRERESELRQAQSKAFAAAQELARCRNEINVLDLQKQGNLVRLEKLSAEKIQLEEERARLDTRLGEFQGSLEREKQVVLDHRGTVEQRQTRLKEVARELNALTQQMEEFLRRQAETRSRLHVLEQLETGYEGFSSGSVAALRQSTSALGSLADKIRVPNQYVPAIEAALGHQLQLVLTARPEEAQQILADLETNRKGRASVAALDLLHASPHAPHTPPPAHEPSAAANPDAWVEEPTNSSLIPQPSLAESESKFELTPPSPSAFRASIPAWVVVQAEPTILPLIQRLLGMTRIVPSLSDAINAWTECCGAYDFVTSSGELLSRHGVFTGGAAPADQSAPASILGRKNQIEDLRADLAALQEEVAALSRSKGASLSEQTSLQASLQEAQSDLHTHEVSVATRVGELSALQESLRALGQKVETVVYEIQSLAAHEEEGLERRAILTNEAQACETTEKAAGEAVARLGAHLDALRQDREASNASLTESKVALATEEQLLAAHQRQHQPLEQRIEELSQVVRLRQAELGSVGERKSQSEREIDESRRAIAKLRIERDVLNTNIASRLSGKEAQEIEIAASEETLRSQRRRLTDLQENRSTVEIELTQRRMNLENLCERIRQRYQLSLEDIRSECITITLAAEGPPTIMTLSPEEMAASGAATDWNAVADQVAALQKRIEELGPVNLVAIEEYEETEQRHQFLTSQHDDLVKAREQLLQAINRINTQTRQMFLDTFEKIRENFRGLFVEVFGGGKADLTLVDENDVLESGIEIVARPPGKQLQNISLLSGGEQTMTAVALLFAIYQVKPSPFCVLDELDAPLDESNINRFVAVLRRFLTHSQFIIITHNKRTIAMADVLYGVTMQEQGISKIVSIKFKKNEDEEDERQQPRATSRLQPPVETTSQDDPAPALLEAPPQPEPLEAIGQ